MSCTGGGSRFKRGAGRGSDFIVRFPLLLAEPARDDGETASPESSTTNESRRILLIDDNVDLTSTMSALLRLGGHEVAVCCDGPSGLEAASELQPEVILVDIGLPGMDGYEVANRLRQSPQYDRTMLVAITGYGQADDRRRAREAGFDHHLVKPVFFEVLQQLLTGPELTARLQRAASAAR